MTYDDVQGTVDRVAGSAILLGVKPKNNKNSLLDRIGGRQSKARNAFPPYWWRYCTAITFVVSSSWRTTTTTTATTSLLRIRIYKTIQQQQCLSYSRFPTAYLYLLSGVASLLQARTNWQYNHLLLPSSLKKEERRLSSPQTKETCNFAA